MPTAGRHVLARLPLACVLGLALLLRLAAGVWHAQTEPANWVPLAGETFAQAGEDGYLQLAHSLLHTGSYELQGLPCHHRPPATALLMAAAAAHSPRHWMWLWLLASCMMGVAAVWLAHNALHCLGAAVWQKSGLALLLAMHPGLVLAVRTSTFLPVGVLAMAGMVWACARWHSQPTLGRACTLGAVAGLAAWVHGSLIVAGPVFALGILISTNWQKWRHAGLCLLVAAVCIAPWTIRNYLVFNTFIPIVSGAGLQFWAGLGVATGNRALPVEVYAKATGGDFLPNVHYGTATPAQDALLAGLAMQHVATHPGAFATHYASGLLRFWVPAYESAAQQALAAMLNLPVVAIWLAIVRRRWRNSGGWQSPAVGPEVLTLALWALFAAFYPHSGYVALGLLPLAAAAALRMGYPVASVQRDTTIFYDIKQQNLNNPRKTK